LPHAGLISQELPPAPAEGDEAGLKRINVAYRAARDEGATINALGATRDVCKNCQDRLPNYERGPSGFHGYNLTQAGRLQFARDVSLGRAATPRQQQQQGAAEAKFSKEQRKFGA